MTGQAEIPREKVGPAFLMYTDDVLSGYEPFAFESFVANGRILVFGLPRHGNHWIVNLIADCLKVRQVEKVTFTHSSLGDAHLLDRTITRAVCLMRDIRDVIVSVYHFLPHAPRVQSSTMIHYNDIGQFYFDFFTKIYVSLPPWANWVTFPDNLVTVGVPILRYEKLYDNPVVELERLFKYWAIDIPKENIEQSVAQNSMKVYKSGQKESLKNRPMEHFRRGGHGHYADELPPIVLEDVNRRYGEYLRNWGYEV